MTMTVEEMVQKYKIVLAGENIRIFNAVDAQKGDALAQIKAAKPEIIEYLKAQADEQKRKKEERRERIDGIEGLKELRDAIGDMNRWNVEYEKSFDDVGGLGVRPKPHYDYEEMYRRYPRAKAYLDAETLSMKSNFELSAIGEKALEMVIYGDWKEAVRYMQEKRNAIAEKHMWD